MTENPSKLSSHDRRVTIPPKVWASLVFYTNDERGRVQSEEVKSLITPESMAVEIITGQLKKMGHYPPKDLPAPKPVSDIMVGS